MRTHSACLLALLVQWSICLGAGAHSANEPAPRGDQGWKDRQALLNRRAQEAGTKARVIFIGDSITQGWEGAGKEVWEQHYAPRNAVNLGIGGDRTQHVLWRLDNGNVDGLKPAVAVVMIGTNNSNGEDNSVEQIADGIAAIVGKLRAKLPDTKVLLVAIFPRSENPSPQRGKILMVNQIVRNLADDDKVHWIDFGHRFVGSDGRIPTDLMPDYLHLSKRGYEIWAEAIEGKLAALLGDGRAGAAATSGGLSGDWVWTMNTPNGETSAALVLKQEGSKITGKFARDETRWLEIQDGTVNGNEFAWTVKRDRPDGSIVTYRMTGRLEGDRIKAQAKTMLDGNEATSEWTAKRK